MYEQSLALKVILFLGLPLDLPLKYSILSAFESRLVKFFDKFDRIEAISVIANEKY